MIWHLIIVNQKSYISSVSEVTLIKPFYFEFYNKIEQILSIGDETGDWFSVYQVKFLWGSEVFYSLFPEFQVRHEGRFKFHGLRKSDER